MATVRTILAPTLTSGHLALLIACNARWLKPCALFKRLPNALKRANGRLPLSSAFRLRLWPLPLFLSLSLLLSLSLSRRYIKRIYRIPKDRGAMECFATILVKTLIKHGWPAEWQAVDYTDGFVILDTELGSNLGPDFLAAVSIASRIVARTYALDVTCYDNWLGLNRNYTVLPSGQFREVKT